MDLLNKSKLTVSIIYFPRIKIELPKEIEANKEAEVTKNLFLEIKKRREALRGTRDVTSKINMDESSSGSDWGDSD